jgi:hypothetical protein
MLDLDERKVRQSIYGAVAVRTDYDRVTKWWKSSAATRTDELVARLPAQSPEVEFAN